MSRGEGEGRVPQARAGQARRSPIAGVGAATLVPRCSLQRSDSRLSLPCHGFAHEGAILRILVSEDGKTLLSCADDQTIKLWDTSAMKQRLVFEKQPDWPSAAAFIGSERILVGRMDGSLELYNASTGKGTAVETASK